MISNLQIVPSHACDRKRSQGWKWEDGTKTNGERPTCIFGDFILNRDPVAIGENACIPLNHSIDGEVFLGPPPAGVAQRAGDVRFDQQGLYPLRHFFGSILRNDEARDSVFE